MLRSSLLALFGMLLLAANAHAATCSPFGVDTIYATSYDTPILGEAYGQVFTATAPFLRSITVWRSNAGSVSGDALHLFLTRADSTGRPLSDSLVADGGTVTMPAVQGGPPTPFRFEFSPPLPLPGPGSYYFAVQGSPCGSLINILFAESNPYPDGSVWRNHRTFTSTCHLAPGIEAFPDADFVFAVELCESDTPALATSWGRVKSVYR